MRTASMFTFATITLGSSTSRTTTRRSREFPNLHFSQRRTFSSTPPSRLAPMIHRLIISRTYLPSPSPSPSPLSSYMAEFLFWISRPEGKSMHFINKEYHPLALPPPSGTGRNSIRHQEIRMRPRITTTSPTTITSVLPPRSVSVWVSLEVLYSLLALVLRRTSSSSGRRVPEATKRSTKTSARRRPLVLCVNKGT